MGKKGWLSLAALALAVVVVVSAAFLVRDHRHKDTAKPSAPTSGTAKQPDGPSGCVGGTDTSTAISTAFHESLNPRGAVQFTGTVLRWLHDSSTQQSQINNVGPRLMDADLWKPALGITDDMPSGGRLSFSTKNSYAWIKDFDAKKGTATVLFTGKSIATAPSEGTATQDEVWSMHLVNRDGHWFMTKPSADDTKDKNDENKTHQLERGTVAHGTPVAGGCGE